MYKEKLKKKMYMRKKKRKGREENKLTVAIKTLL